MRQKVAIVAEREIINTWSPRVLAVLRIVTGLLFMQHGTAKLLGVPHIAMFPGAFSVDGIRKQGANS
jgi:uncharacterized membrane protein YphA (DoxX/SURF4 family)